MELGGLLKFLEFLQSTETAGHVTERDIRRKRLRVEGVLWFFFGVARGLNFFGFDLCSILRGENLSALEIFFGVNVLGFFLLRFLAGAFLFRGFGHILSATFGGDKNGAGKKQNAREAQT
jgi:hypothetical protein